MTKHFFRISNSNYATLPSLPNAISDGEAVEQCFSKLGYQIHAQSDLTRDGMDAFLSRFSEIACSDQCNVAVFYYSGHGAHDVTTYLIPTDAQVRSAHELAKCVSYQSILTRLVPAGCPVILILDCCRTPTLAAQFPIHPARLEAPTEHVFTLFASAEQNPAFDSFQGDDRGPLARFIVESFETGRTSNIRETLGHIQHQVRSLTAEADPRRRRYIYRQEPQIIDPAGLGHLWDWNGRHEHGLTRPPIIRHWKAAAPQVQTQLDAADLTILQYYHEVTKFIPTEDILEQFEHFMSDPAQISFLLVTGDAGVGKSRLCSKLCQQHENVLWTTGFLNYLNPNLRTFDWKKWVPGTNYLLVIDDCNDREDYVSAMIGSLQQLAINTERRIRIVLCDRQIDEDIKDAAGSFTPATPRLTYSLRSLHCQPLSPEAGQQLYVDALTFFLPGRPVERSQLVRASVRPLYASGNPLEILLNAMWYASGQAPSTSPMSRRRELSKWLYHHTRDTVRRSSTTKKNDVFAALASICGGVAVDRWNEMKARAPALCEEWLDERKHHVYVGSSIPGRYVPIRPDRLAEAFVFEVLFGKDRHVRNSAQVSQLLDLAWSISSLRTANFLVRLVRAYGHDAVGPQAAARPPSVGGNAAATLIWLNFAIDVAPRPCPPGRFQDILRQTYGARIRLNPRIISSLIRLAPRDNDAADIFQAYADADAEGVTPQVLEALSNRAGPYVSKHLTRWLAKIRPSARLLNNLIERLPPADRLSLFSLFDDKRHPLDDRTIQNRIKYGPDQDAAKWTQLACERNIFVSQNFFSVLFSRFGLEKFLALCEPIFRLRPALINYATVQKLLYNDRFGPQEFLAFLAALGTRRVKDVVSERHGTVILKKCTEYAGADQVVKALTSIGLNDNKFWVSARARLATKQDLLDLASLLDSHPALRDDHALAAMLRNCADSKMYRSLPESLRAEVTASRDPFVLYHAVRFATEEEFTALADRIFREPRLLTGRVAGVLMRSEHCSRKLAARVWKAIHESEDLNSFAYAGYLRHLDSFSEVAQCIDEMREFGLQIGGSHIAHAIRTAPTAEEAKAIFAEFADEHEIEEHREFTTAFLEYGPDLHEAFEALKARNIRIGPKELVKYLALLPDERAKELVNDPYILEQDVDATSALFLKNVRIAKLARSDPEAAKRVLREIVDEGLKADIFSITPILPRVPFAEAEKLIDDYKLRATADLELFNAWLSSAQNSAQADKVLTAIKFRELTPDATTFYLRGRHVETINVLEFLRDASARPEVNAHELASHVLNVQGREGGYQVLEACAELNLKPSTRSVIRFFNLQPLADAEKICAVLQRLHGGVGARFIENWATRASSYEDLAELFRIREKIPFKIRGIPFRNAFRLIESKHELYEASGHIFSGQSWADTELQRLLIDKARELLESRELRKFVNFVRRHK